MKKSEIRSRLTDYIEGDLSLRERALVDAHLDANPEMAQEVAELRRTVDLLRSLPAEEGPIDLPDRVMERIRAGEARPPLWVRARRAMAEGRHLGWAVPVTAACAVVAVAALRGDLVLPGDLLREPAGELAAGAPRATETVARAERSPGRASEEAPPAVVPRRAPEGAPTLVTRRAADGSPLIGAGAAPGDPPAAGSGDPAGPRTSATRVAAASPSGDEPGAAEPGSTPDAVGPAGAPQEPSSAAARSEVASTQPSPGPPVRVQPASSELGAPVTVGGPTTGPTGAEFVRSVGGEVVLPRSESDDARRGEQQLDRRLELLLRSPELFLRELRGDSVAAQELWLGELAARAVERDLEDRVLAALQGSGHVEALSVVRYFERAVERARSDTVASEAPLE